MSPSWTALGPRESLKQFIHNWQTGKQMNAKHFENALILLVNAQVLKFEIRDFIWCTNSYLSLKSEKSFTNSCCSLYHSLPYMFTVPHLIWKSEARQTPMWHLVCRSVDDWSCPICHSRLIPLWCNMGHLSLGCHHQTWHPNKIWNISRWRYVSLLRIW